MAEINSKLSLSPILPIFLGASGFALVVLLLLRAPDWAYFALAIVAIGLSALARYRDVVARSVVIMYDIDSNVLEPYSKVHDAIAALSSSAKAWHISQSANIQDRKYHAGASAAVTRQAISITDRSLPAIKTNLDIPILPAGKQLLAFTPERLLVFEQKRVGAVPYAEVSVQIDQTRFFEEEGVPPDSQVVDKTWRYVNKKGGPDRRFKDNRELPIVLYERMHLTSPSGLNELFNFSKIGVAQLVNEALREMATAIASLPVDTGMKTA